MQTLGQKIKVLRLAKGLTQEGLAEKLKYSKSFISYVESGERALSDWDLERIARELDVSTNDLKSEKAVVAVHFRSALSGSASSEAHKKIADAFSEYAEKHLKAAGNM